MRTLRECVEKEKEKVMPKGFHVEMMGFSDMSVAPFGSHSQECIEVSLAGSPTHWKATKQSLVATSTCEGELIVALDAFAATRSMTTMLQELVTGEPLCEKLFKNEVRLAVDNSAAVQILSGAAASHWRTRHLRVKSAAITEAVEQGYCKVAHIPGTEQLADIGTKTLPTVVLERLKSLAGMESLADAKAESSGEKEVQGYEVVENGKVKFITTPNGLARRLLASVVVADLVERVNAGRGKELVFVEKVKEKSLELFQSKTYEDIDWIQVALFVVIAAGIFQIVAWIARIITQTKVLCCDKRCGTEGRCRSRKGGPLEKEPNKDVVYVTSGGECFHVHKDCRALLHAKVQLRERCKFCARKTAEEKARKLERGSDSSDETELEAKVAQTGQTIKTD